MSKIKMRCITCGKWFQSANAKEVTCPDCMQKSRRDKLAAKNTAPPYKPEGNNRPITRPPVTPKQKQIQGGGTSHWLDTQQDVKLGQPEQQTSRPRLPPPPRARELREQEQRSGQPPFRYQQNTRESAARPFGYRDEYRPQTSFRPGQRHFGAPPHPRQNEFLPGRPPQRSPQQQPSLPNRQSPARGRPTSRPAIPTPTPKPRVTKIPPPQPFVPSAEQIAQVEKRYLELATPHEFDGIRSQIAHEVQIPKKSVKKIIKDLRDRQSIPSWWETQTYHGPAEDLERVRASYLPLLPVPPVGVHKILSDQLEIKPGIVYQAIKTIRQELSLPQYNQEDDRGAAWEVFASKEDPIAQLLPDSPVSVTESLSSPSEL